MPTGDVLFGCASNWPRRLRETKMTTASIPDPTRPPSAERAGRRVGLAILCTAVLISANGYLWFRGEGLRRTSALSHQRLTEARLAEATRDQETARATLRRRALSVYDAYLGESDGIDSLTSLRELRRRLVQAETATGVRRELLELREGDSGAILVRLQVRGGFQTLWAYLDALERLRLPMSLQELSIRPAAGEGLSMSGSFRAVLKPSSPGQASDHEAIDRTIAEALPEIERWLTGEAQRPSRDPFEPANVSSPSTAVAGSDHAPDSGSKAAQPSEAPRIDSRIRLGGFVKPSADEAPYRAAIELDGVIHLVEVGDRLEQFEVSSIEFREHVVLVDARDGSRLTLRLEQP